METALKEQFLVLAWKVVYVLYLLGLLEILSLGFLSTPTISNHHSFYRPTELTNSQLSQYLKKRNPILGWTVQQRSNNPDACLSVYGDSFTYGLHVEDKQSWPSLIAKTIGCKVSNYGVNGFGVDQAVIRFLNNDDDHAKTTILGIYSDDLNRNLNQWRYLLGSNALSFKPVFDNSGSIVPILINNLSDYLHAANNPEKFLTKEAYLPDKGPFCKSKMRITFPYSLTILKFAWRSFRCRHFIRYTISDSKKIRFFPLWFDDDPTFISSKIAKNKLIVEKFEKACRIRKKKCFILFMPDAETLKNVRFNGINPTEIIYPSLGNSYLDVSNFISSRLKDKNVCRIFVDGCGGHYNAEGHALVAKIVLDHFFSAR